MPVTAVATHGTPPTMILGSSGRTSPSVLAGTHDSRAAHAGAGSGGGRRSRDQPQNLGEQHSRNGDLGHLEGNVAAVADELGADLDQLLPQAGQRPVLDRLRRCKRAQAFLCPAFAQASG